MKTKDTVTRQTPCPCYDVEACESWLTDQAARGLFLEQWGLYTARFRRDIPRVVRYRITAARLKGSVLFSAPSAPGEEETDLYAAAGWEFVCAWQEFFFYCCQAPQAPELHTDPAIQSISLKMAVRTAVSNFLAQLLILTVMAPRSFREFPFSTLAEDPLLCLLYLLFFLSILLLTGRNLYSIFRFRHRLRQGLPPRHQKDWRPTARIHCLLVNLARCSAGLLFLVLLSSVLVPSRATPLSNYHEPLPFATLSDLAEGTLVPDEDPDRNAIALRHTLLAPAIYHYYESGQITQNGQVVLDASLTVTYYDTRFSWLAQQLAGELHETREPYADLPEPLPALPGIDAAWAYRNENGAFRQLILCKGSRVMSVFWTDSEHTVDFQHLIPIFADIFSNAQ